jgi:hypothetical protein
MGYTVASSVGLRYGVGLHGVQDHMISKLPNALEVGSFSTLYTHLLMIIL